jgi:hypothetical protein
MADTKISDLTALLGANVASDDEFAIVDTDTNTTKRIVASELLAYIADALVANIVTITATDADYDPPPALCGLILDDAGDNTDIDVTLNAALTSGSLLFIYAQDGGAASHTITLGGSQTWDGTNTIADFDTAGDFLAVFVFSATVMIILANNGVTFS